MAESSKLDFAAAADISGILRAGCATTVPKPQFTGQHGDRAGQRRAAREDLSPGVWRLYHP